MFLIIVTMLYIRSLDLLIYKTANFVPFDQNLHIFPTAQPLVTNILLFFYEFAFFSNSTYK